MDTEKKKRRQKRRKIIGLIFGLICIAALALLPFILEGAKQEMSKASILSGRVETGAIEKTVSGAGMGFVALIELVKNMFYRFFIYTDAFIPDRDEDLILIPAELYIDRSAVG